MRGKGSRAGASGAKPRPRKRAAQTVRIDDLTHDGRGVTHIDGKVVFVSRALPGELVRIARRRSHRRHDEAELLEILEPSDRRITPRCKHFEICGGCSMQHITAADQIEAKQRVLLENLSRIGQVTPERVLEPLTAQPWAYRRRARLGVRHVRSKGRVLVGFRERLSPTIADIDSCEILSAPVGHLLHPLSELIRALTVRERIAQIEVAQGEDATVLVLRNLAPLSSADLSALRAFERAHGVCLCLQAAGPESVVDVDGAPSPTLHYTLPAFAVTIGFLPGDFVQINARLNERMVERAVELLALQGDEKVLDLFAGVGNFTLPLARRASQVVAVEGEGALVARLRDNALRNGLEGKIQAHVADLSEDITPFPWAKGAYDALLLDPSRAGAHGVVPMVRRWKPARICYVSCHAGTLARDAGKLVNEHGYRLRQVGVIDMFPHTGHVESIAVFERGR